MKLTFHNLFLKIKLHLNKKKDKCLVIIVDIKVLTV